VTRLLTALCALLAAVALAPPASGAERPSAADLEAEIVCPTCRTTLDQSDAPIARRMKAYIRERIAAGASAAQIKRELIDEFGPGVLAEPPKRGFDLLAWALPLAAVAIGAVALGAAVWAWSRRTGDGGDAVGQEPLDADLERRVDDELARFDA
jgi:cytochrome c-type biogenesis protein CcmH